MCEFCDWDSHNRKWYEASKAEDPEGVKCGKCRADNSFFDDCGWFYWFPMPWPNNLAIPVCRLCFNELGLTTGER